MNQKYFKNKNLTTNKSNQKVNITAYYNTFICIVRNYNVLFQSNLHKDVRSWQKWPTDTTITFSFPNKKV